jgi:hypothetical protein
VEVVKFLTVPRLLRSPRGWHEKDQRVFNREIESVAKTGPGWHRVTSDGHTLVFLHKSDQQSILLTDLPGSNSRVSCSSPLLAGEAVSCARHPKSP